MCPHQRHDLDDPWLSTKPSAPTLDLRSLALHAMRGLTPEVADAFAQAAAVCLDSQCHKPGALLHVQRRSASHHSLDWTPPTQQARRAWRDEREATEYGASGIAILIAFRIMGFSVTSRSRKGTGFDYWLGRDPGQPPFREEVRLEVSGIRRGGARDIRRRVNAKRRQMARGSSRLPGFVMVIEFSEPLAWVATA